jgi:Domain of unknown function (DUF4190)
MAYDPPPVYVQPARTSTLAVVSLITGIVGLIAVPVVGSIVAVVTGHMAKREIRESGGQISGDGLATAGLITGYVGLGFMVLGLCLLLVWLIAFAGLFGIALRQTSYLAPLLFA